MECKSNKLFRPWDSGANCQANTLSEHHIYNKKIGLDVNYQSLNLSNCYISYEQSLFNYSSNSIYASSNHDLFVSCHSNKILKATSQFENDLKFSSSCLPSFEKALVNNNHELLIKLKKHRPKRFNCPHCQIAFSNNGQLKGHIRTHTGERPFVCDHLDCGKSFTRNEELTRHRRIHTGIRPYLCMICNKRFGRKDHLKKHQRTHEKRFCNSNSNPEQNHFNTMSLFNSMMLLQMSH